MLNVHVTHAHIKIEFPCLISRFNKCLSLQTEHIGFTIFAYFQLNEYVIYKFDIVYTQQWLTGSHWHNWNASNCAKERTQYAFYDGAGFQFEKSSKFNELEMNGVQLNSIESTNCFSFIQHFWEVSVCFWKLIFHRFGMEHA